MILTVDEDLIMAIGEPMGDYKRSSMGFEQNTQEERVSLEDQFSRE